MEKTIEFKAVVSNLDKGGKTLYRLVPVGINTMKDPEFISTIASGADIPASRAQYFMNVFAKTLVNAVMERKIVDLGFMSARLVIEGSLERMSDQPNVKDNPVRIRITFKGPIDEALAGIVLKNVSKMVEAALHEVMQTGASAINRIENMNEIVFNGKGLRINSDAEDEGVTLEKNDTIIAKATTNYSDDSTIKATFDNLEVERGVYDLCVYTRDGKRPSEVSTPRKLTRKVTVALG